jgi:hypothetical protein
MEKMIKKIRIVEAHPKTMSAGQISEWMEVLQTIDGLRVHDLPGNTPERCKKGCMQSIFVIHFGNIAEMVVTLDQMTPGSRDYLVSSRTIFYNGEPSNNGGNTHQREVLRQQELFMQQHHAATQHAIEQHQLHVNQHMHHVMMAHHHHHNF